MVLGCSVCNQPLVIRPNIVGYQDPNSLMKTCRPTDINDNIGSKANVDLTDAEIVATRCGHMFHRECLKNYLQGSLTKLNGKPQGCPMCRKPVIQSQLWPIIIRATREELRQIEKIKHLKNKNAELVTAIKEIRNNTQEKNAALQDARKKMFDYRVKLQGMDIQSVSKGNLEKLEKKQGDLERELAAVNDQNMALTSLVERESVYGQKIRSEQNKTISVTNDNDPFTTTVKQMASSRVHKEAINSGLVEKSSRNPSRINDDPPMIVKDALERWRQMKSSLRQNEDGVDRIPPVPVKKQDLSFNFLRENSINQMQKSSKRNNLRNKQSRRPRSRSRSKTPPPSSAEPYIPNKIATTGLGSDLWKLENRVRSRYN